MSTSTATASTSAATQPNPPGAAAPPAANNPPKQPHPLDGLSPTDLRIKLEQSRKDLRGMLEKKRKIDRELVSPRCSSLRDQMRASGLRSFRSVSGLTRGGRRSSLRGATRHAYSDSTALTLPLRAIFLPKATLEASIYAFEGSYLSDSLFPPSSSSQSSSAAAAQFGNIIRGYDSYLKAPSSSSGDRKRGGRPGDNAAEKERMFSASSATYQRVSLLSPSVTKASPD